MAGFRTLGDLSTSYLLSRQTTLLKAEVQRRSDELGSGRLADLSAALRGDFTPLASVARGLDLAEAGRVALAEARGFAEGVQTALAVVEEQGETLAATLLAIALPADAPAIARGGAAARQAFDAAVGALNQTLAGRALFAGTATDGPALAAPQTMLAALEAAVAAETTAGGVLAAVDAWFDTPGSGFETTGYLGAATPLAPVPLGGGRVAAGGPTAADPGLRPALKAFALGALLERPILGGDPAERAALARATADRALTATGRVTDLRARTGDAEAAIAASETRLSTERAALTLARNEMTGADPYEAATRLEAARTQLETLYTLTARVSRLSLADFLR